MSAGRSWWLKSAFATCAVVTLVVSSCRENPTSLPKLETVRIGVRYEGLVWACAEQIFNEGAINQTSVWHCSWQPGGSTTYEPFPPKPPGPTTTSVNFPFCGQQPGACGGVAEGINVGGGHGSVADDTGWPSAEGPLNPDDEATQVIFDCKQVLCPTPTQLLASENVQTAAAHLMKRTAQTGKEYGAWLYMNPDGTIRVGEIMEGTYSSMPQLRTPPDKYVVGSIHSHPPGAALPSSASSPDLWHAVTNNIYVVVIGGDGNLHVGPSVPAAGWKVTAPTGGGCILPPC